MWLKHSNWLTIKQRNKNKNKRLVFPNLMKERAPYFYPYPYINQTPYGGGQHTDDDIYSDMGPGGIQMSPEKNVGLGLGRGTGE